MKPEVLHIFIYSPPRTSPILTAVSIARLQMQTCGNIRRMCFWVPYPVEPAPPTPKVRTPPFWAALERISERASQMSSRSLWSATPALSLQRNCHLPSTYPSRGSTWMCTCLWPVTPATSSSSRGSRYTSWKFWWKRCSSTTACLRSATWPWSKTKCMPPKWRTSRSLDRAFILLPRKSCRVVPRALSPAGGLVMVCQACPTLGDPVDCSLPGCSLHGILQARVLECHLELHTWEFWMWNKTSELCDFLIFKMMSFSWKSNDHIPVKT